jgi:transcriptional regulator with XRE-family HTH domain
MINTYSERIAAAMKAANCSTSALAAALGVSYQAVKKVLDGKSNALTAENNAKGARFLGVSSHWLATGEGEMIPSNGTPSVRFALPSDGDVIEIAHALQALDEHLHALAPVLQDAGRDILRKWLAGTATVDDAVQALEAMAMTSKAMGNKKD